MIKIDNKFYVYIYVITLTGEVFYVGKGSGERAWRGKRNVSCEDVKKTNEWTAIIIKDDISEEMAFRYEEAMIRVYRKEGQPITNITDGGDGISGYRHTEEHKARQSHIAKKLWENSDFLARHMYHRLHGVYQSQEFKDRISSLVTGEDNPNYGNSWTQEQKDAMSKKRKENGKSKGANNPRATKIRCIETGVVYAYIKLASDEYGFKSQSSITVALNNPNRTAGGVHWERIEE